MPSRPLPHSFCVRNVPKEARKVAARGLFRDRDCRRPGFLELPCVLRRDAGRALSGARRMPEHTVHPEDLRELLLEHLHVEVPSVDTDLLESGALDSLQLVDLLLVIEQRFGWRIPIESLDLDQLRSLTRLAGLVGTPRGVRHG